VVFVTGKGGVGKSTVAATLAYRAALDGRRVILVELAEQSYLRHLLNLEIGFQPTPWRERLDVACWDGAACLREYLKHYVRIEAVVDLFFKNMVMKTFIQAAPALKEISILGKATSGIRRVGPSFEYDLVVVDAFATGHFRALLRAPKGLAEAVKFGPMGDQTRQIDQLLRDPKHTNTVIVTLPEELPISECDDLRRDLANEFGIQARVICNKLWDIPLEPTALVRLSKQFAGRDPGGLELVNYLDVVEERQRQALQALRAIDPEFISLTQRFAEVGENLIATLAERVKLSDLGL
jgi:anion-transporting  ArsA/GET3 family ATPase